MQHAFKVEMAIDAGSADRRPDVPQRPCQPMAACCSTGALRGESQMWMRNTVAPLDMVFINADGTIRSIAENTSRESLAISIAAARCAQRSSWRRGHGPAEHPGGRQGAAAAVRERGVRDTPAGRRAPARTAAAARRQQTNDETGTGAPDGVLCATECAADAAAGQQHNERNQATEPRMVIILLVVYRG